MPRETHLRTHRNAALRQALVCLVSALAVSILAPAQALAQATAGGASSIASSDPAQRVLDSLSIKGDLTLRNSTLEDALFTISELWDINIVAGQVDGSVNGVFKDAPLREILDSILISNGYAYRPVGGSLVVSSLQDLGQVNPFFEAATIPVGAASVNEVVEAARLLSTPQGQVRPLPSAGAVLVVDFPDQIEKIRELIIQVDRATRGIGSPGGSPLAPQQLEVAYFRTHYVPAVQAAQAIDVVLSSAGRVSALELEDRLLVVDYEENVRMVESVLARVDRPRPQVNIKSLIYDISLSDIEEIGVNWDGITSGAIDATGVATPDDTGLRFLTQTKAPFDATGDGGSFTFFSLSPDFNIQALVLALQQAEDSRLLADPNVTVIDNETALVESISEIPFQQLTQTGAGGNIGTTAFKEVGIKLDVTPKIANDKTIDLTVIPEFSRLAGFTPGDNQPITETRRATTRVRIRNGQTLMIAGLRQRTDVGDFSGIPLLKDIRYFGYLFRARDTQIEESELVVFITPEIVGYSDPLGHRDRLTSDTVGCRLDRIPAAEGCPPCDPCGPGIPCGPGSECLEYPMGPTMMAPPESIPAPEIVPPSPASARAVPPSARVEQASGLAYPDLTPEEPRRLPPTATGAAGESSSPDWPMRPDYDSRYRPTGGVYANQQRLTEPDTGMKNKPDAEPKEAKRSWRDMLLLR